MNINEMTRRMLIDQANKDMAKWPQYKDRFNDYVLYRMKRSLKTKMGLAFEKGELAIGRVETTDFGGETAVTLYSVRNRIDTTFPARYTEKVA